MILTCVANKTAIVSHERISKSHSEKLFLKTHDVLIYTHFICYNLTQLYFAFLNNVFFLHITVASDVAFRRHVTVSVFLYPIQHATNIILENVIIYNVLYTLI